MSKKNLPPIISVILLSPQICEAGHRRVAGETLTVGTDICATRALDLCLRGQIVGSDAALNSGVDLQTLLEKAVLDADVDAVIVPRILADDEMLTDASPPGLGTPTSSDFLKS